MFVFIILHNFVESDFLEGDGPAWVAFVLVLACLHTRNAADYEPNCGAKRAMERAMTPFFSVIIPVYNRAHVLGRALKSVFAQSCQDFEIVVVDDGSSDDPAAVIARFADPRITYIRQRNRGGGAARNAGIDAARGQFIAPLDSDDEFLPGHLARMKALLEGTRRRCGLCTRAGASGERQVAAEAGARHCARRAYGNLSPL